MLLAIELRWLKSSESHAFWSQICVKIQSHEEKSQKNSSFNSWNYFYSIGIARFILALVAGNSFFGYWFYDSFSLFSKNSSAYAKTRA